MRFTIYYEGIQLCETMDYNVFTKMLYIYIILRQMYSTWK
jgi:hypothetical protein